MSAGRAWIIRDLGQRTAAAHAVRARSTVVSPGRGPREDILRNPGPRATALPGRLARQSGHAVARVLGAGAHTVTTSVTHAVHRVVQLAVVSDKSTIPAGRWHN